MCRPGLQLSKDLTGARGSVPRMAHPHGCWLETSVPPHVYHAIKLHRCLYSMACGFLQREGPRNRLQRKQQCPVTGSSKSRTVTFFLSSFFFFFCYFGFFFSVRNESPGPAHTQEEVNCGLRICSVWF